MIGLRLPVRALLVIALVACVGALAACALQARSNYTAARISSWPPPGYMTLGDQSPAPLQELWIIATDRSPPPPRPVGPEPPRAGGAGANMAYANSAARVPVPASPILINIETGQRPSPILPKHTDVHATIAGGIASVAVTQQFVNDTHEKLAAVYVFPLPENAGIRDFVVTIGERHIRGIIREREEAQQIYDRAGRQGMTVTLLNELRPNVFAQNIANIEPGKQINIELQYFHCLDYRDGAFEWRFPMTLGPIAGNINSSGQSAPPANSPAAFFARPAMRSGRDIALSVALDPGFPITSVESPGHAIHQTSGPGDSATIELIPADSIANQDFILRFRPASAGVHAALLLEKDPHGAGGWFSVLLVPPAAPQNPEGRAPILAGIQLAFEPATPVAEQFPRTIPDLFAGEPFLITGRYTGDPPSGVTISGTAGDQKTQLRAAASRFPAAAPPLAALWASMKIGDLRHSANAADAIKTTALSHGLISEYTSFIAVDATGN